jgi:hypothetical protein
MNEKSQTSNPNMSQKRELLFKEATSSKTLRTFSNQERGILSPPDLNLTDLELMTQWCSETYRTFTRNKRTESIWKSLIPQEALSHPFLMHGLLAISALHLSRIKGEQFKSAYIGTAVAHQTQALALFRNSLNNINFSNVKAIFAFASITIVYSFASPPALNPDNTLTSISNLYQVLILSRGIHHLLKMPEVSLRGSGFEHGFEHLVDSKEHPLLLPNEARLSLTRLYEANSTCRLTYVKHDTSTYQETIGLLKEALGTMYAGHPIIIVAGKWVIKVPQQYPEYLQEREPLALVILIFYCVVLHRLRGLWCVEDWGMRVSKAIWLTLDVQWRSLAHWAIIEIFGEIPCF